LDPHAERHTSFGRSDFVLKSAGQTWVVEVKVSHGYGDDSAKAKSALNQIKKKKYGEGYDNPVLLGLVVNDKARRIKAWECEGGLAKRPTQDLAPSPKPTRAKKTKQAKLVEEENLEDNESKP
jgi:hypothetical protein